MKLIKSILAASVVLASLTTANAQSADEIMEKHQKAIGGLDAWNNVKSVLMKGTMSIQGMEMNVTQTMDLGNAMRTDIEVMGIKGYTIITQNAGWTYMPFMPGMDKLDTMKPDMLKAAQSQLVLKGKDDIEYKKKGTKAEYAGRDTIEKVPCYKIKFIDKNGGESYSYYDASTYYLLRTETTSKQEDNVQEITIGYNNYKKMDGGVVMPMSVTAGGGEITFKTIEINKPIDKKVFIPEDPKASAKSKEKK